MIRSAVGEGSAYMECGGQAVPRIQGKINHDVRASLFPVE
jgi:hypothetical protein